MSSKNLSRVNRIREVLVGMANVECCAHVFKIIQERLQRLPRVFIRQDLGDLGCIEWRLFSNYGNAYRLKRILDCNLKFRILAKVNEVEFRLKLVPQPGLSNLIPY